MPEGPEVRRAADRIEKALKGSEICAVEVCYPSLLSAESWLLQTRLKEVKTFGKGFALCFENQQSIYVHLQLYVQLRQ